MPATETTWILAADASRARVLQVASREKLAEVASLDNPERRVHDRDRLSPTVEHATETFAKHIGEYLEKARTDHRYDHLVVIAPPHLLGALRKEYGKKEVGKLVSQEVAKDLTWLSKHELQGYFSKDGRAV